MPQGSLRRAKGFASWVLAAGLGFAAFPVAAQLPVPQGPEFEVDSDPTNYHTYPTVAAADDGNFVVVWKGIGSPGTDASGYSIQGQRFASDGSAQGAQFQVNTYTTSNQAQGSVATAANGDFVVAWSSLGSSGADSSYESIQGQRYGSDGSTQGAEFQVNTYTTQGQRSPSVAAAGNGDFVVVWDSIGSSGTDTSQSSIQGQRYASDGSTQGAEFQVNTYTTQNQARPAVAAAAGGDFVVVWVSFGSPGSDTDSYSIQGQRFGSDGSPQGAEFQINTYTTDAQLRPAVAAAAGGDFVVVWESVGSAGTDTQPSSVQGQRYASDGSAQGAEFQVNSYTTLSQGRPSLSLAANGDFVVVWQSDGSFLTDNSYSSIQSQRYASNGSALGGELQVNTETLYNQIRPSVAAASNGNFVVAWQSYVAAGPGWDVKAQRYSVTTAVAVPALSPPAGLALGAMLMLIGAIFARGYGKS